MRRVKRLNDLNQDPITKTNWRYDSIQDFYYLSYMI